MKQMTGNPNGFHNDQKLDEVENFKYPEQSSLIKGANHNFTIIGWKETSTLSLLMLNWCTRVKELNKIWKNFIIKHLRFYWRLNIIYKEHVTNEEICWKLAYRPF